MTWIRGAALAVLLGTASAASAEDAPDPDPSIFEPNGFGSQITLKADRIVLCSGFEEFTVETIERFLQADIFEGRSFTVLSGEEAEPSDEATVWFVLDDRELDPEIDACAARATNLQPDLTAALLDLFGEGAEERAAAKLAAAGLDKFGVVPPFHSTQAVRKNGDAALVTFSLLTGDALREEVLKVLFGLRPEFCEVSGICRL